LEQLIVTETNSIKEHIATEHDKTIGKINDHIDEEHQKTRKEIVQHNDKSTIRALEETRNLVSEELGRLRIEDNKEHAKTRDHVGHRIQTMQAATLSAAIRDQFLKSLNFQGRDQRFNDVKEAHYKTFQWLFDDMDQAGSGNSSLQDDEDEESDDSSSHQSGDSNGLLDESQELDLVYEDLYEECRGKVKSSYSDWLKSKEVLYWIKAKAGAGKSTLMKFLYNDSRTVQLLDSATSRKTLVLTHFFYLMGSPMQCNIKGLLCTLLYQLLQQDEDGNWVAELFRRNPSLQRKESASNWSEAELKKALSTTLHLTAASHNICLFLDGLDEVHQSDGKHKLLILLEWLKAIGAVRLCVSSRPEEEFNQALSSAWILNLHDLTAVDMYQYALDLLMPLTCSFSELVPRTEAYSYSEALKKYYYTNTPQTLAKTIISKSDGVFLWADIATRSLQRGITYGDTWSTMQQRLDLMPPGLSELYTSMWSRPGEDKRLYCAEAALCFNLVLNWEVCSSRMYCTCWNPKHLRTGSISVMPYETPPCRMIYPQSPPPWAPIPLFQLTFAEHKVLRADLDFGTESTTDLLWNECLRIYKRLPILSAGLLEIIDPLSSVDDVGYEVRNPDVEVRFIHRTAKEFFTDTLEGREILSSDTSSFEKRLSALLRASYLRGTAFRSYRTGQRELFCLPLARFDTVSLTEKSRDLRARFSRKKWLEELCAWQAFHDRGVGLFTMGVDFLGLSLQYGYREYVDLVFSDLSRYTPEYKGYLLVSSSIAHGKKNWIPQGGGYNMNQDSELWNIQDLTRWLESINYLLSQGCKSELTIYFDPFYPFKLTGVEAFLWSLSTIRRRISWSNDPVPCNLIMETLRHFSESGADFMQPVYGYYGRDGLLSKSYPYGDEPLLFGPGPRGEQHGFRSFRQVVVEWSVLGALNWAVKTHHENDYFCARLKEFLATIRMDTSSLSPRVIAVRHPYNPNEDRRMPCDWRLLPSLYIRNAPKKIPGIWMEKAKRVSGKHEERLMNNISQWVSHSDEDRATRMEKLDHELNQIVSSILDDRDVPEGVFGDFLELGFVESWPRFLASELQEMGFTSQMDEDGYMKLPDGVTYPPVKFVN
jgi:hypothetical protein